MAACPRPVSNRAALEANKEPKGRDLDAELRPELAQVMAGETHATRNCPHLNPDAWVNSAPAVCGR